MTNKAKDNEKARDTAEKNEAKRVSPDHPLGTVNTAEERDYYADQRKASPDGMTAQERDQAQKAAPGSLDQRAGDEKIGEAEDYANPVGGTSQSGGKS